MKSYTAGPEQLEDTKELLKCILDELRGIKVQFTRQDEQNEQLHKANANSYISGTVSELRTNGAVIESSNSVPSTPLFSMEARTGPILQEALRRYKSDAIPAWSTLYGTNLSRDEAIEDPEAIARNAEWTSITGDCWKIPNDNRNFLVHFHKSEGNGPLKGENFNVWDWFDTGISAYWFPGKRTSSIPQEALRAASIKATLLDRSKTPQISHLVSPWRRIINLQGLTTLRNYKGPQTQEDLLDSDLCPFLIPDTTESIFQRPIDEMIAQVVKSHLRCLRVSNTCHVEMQIKDCALFHITFYEILQRNPGVGVTELWPCGDLHSDEQHYSKRPRQIRESALTIIAIPSREVPGSKARAIFWTMICLRPSQFPHVYYSEQGDDVSIGRTNEMVDDMSDLINQSLVTVVSRWEEIAHYFDELLTEKRGLLRPEYHDSLLTDDGALSRSKKYFWAIEFLKEAGNSIADNIRQTQRFVAFLESNPPGTKIAESGFQMRVKKHYLTLQKLESLEIRFRQKKEEAVALRDGLFSASAVMESRASTQLGQNIKLLTFVSIFFLPISSCAVLKSIWSVNDTLLSIPALAIAMPVVAICTYILVFNVNRIASFFTRIRTSAYTQRISSVTRQKTSPSFSDTGTPQQHSSSFPKLTPSQIPRSLLIKAWTFVQSGRRLVPQAFRKSGFPERKFSPASLGDLRDVRVKVQVDVESCSVTRTVESDSGVKSYAISPK